MVVNDITSLERVGKKTKTKKSYTFLLAFSTQERAADASLTSQGPRRSRAVSLGTRRADALVKPPAWRDSEPESEASKSRYVG